MTACLNVLAGSKDNACEIYDAAEGHVLVGVLSKTIRTSPARWRRYARDYAKLIDNALSVGLGAGDPNQSAMVKHFSPCSRSIVNQVFHQGYQPRALLGQNETVVNGLVSPTGTPGMVKISTVC